MPAIDFAAHARSLGALAEHVGLDRGARGGARAGARGRSHVRRRHRHRSAAHDRSRRLVVGGRRAGGLRVGQGARRADRIRARQAPAEPMKRSAASAVTMPSELRRAHRHQPDFVDQRRPAGAGRRDAARDGADRRQGDRLRGLRARQQVSARARGAARGARAARPRLRVRLVFGAPRARDASPTRSPRSTRISTLLAANGAQVMVYGEVADSIQGRPEALSRRPRFATRRRVVRLRRARDGVCAAPARPRRASRVPSSHGRLCRDGGRRRPSDARHRPRGRAAARHRPRHVRRRRRADRAAEARRARRATCIARTCARRWRGWRAIAAGASSTPC